MNTKRVSIFSLGGLLTMALAASTVFAAVTFNPATGTGFVGKGDVQLALGLNNAQLQAQADDLEFTSVSTVVKEVSWICTNSNNDNTQERARTTTVSIEGVVSGVARSKNQISGFNLDGYVGTPTESSTTEGNQLNSCPGGPWTLTTPAGYPEVVSSSSELKVNDVLLQ
jgi:hypothetical protein